MVGQFDNASRFYCLKIMMNEKLKKLSFDQWLLQWVYKTVKILCLQCLLPVSKILDSQWSC